MITRWVLLLFLPLLLGFSTSDNIQYVVEYNHNEIEAEILYKQIESYAIAQGFTLNTQIKEDIPKKQLFSEFQMGKLFQGGIKLKLILDEETNRIHLKANRPHGGCSRSDSIEKMDGFQSALQNYIKMKLSISVKVKNITMDQ